MGWVRTAVASGAGRVRKRVCVSRTQVAPLTRAQRNFGRGTGAPRRDTLRRRLRDRCGQFAICSRAPACANGNPARVAWAWLAHEVGARGAVPCPRHCAGRARGRVCPGLRRGGGLLVACRPPSRVQRHTQLTPPRLGGSGRYGWRHGGPVKRRHTPPPPAHTPSGGVWGGARAPPSRAARAARPRRRRCLHPGPSPPACSRRLHTGATYTPIPGFPSFSPGRTPRKVLPQHHAGLRAAAGPGKRAVGHPLPRAPAAARPGAGRQRSD